MISVTNYKLAVSSITLLDGLDTLASTYLTALNADAALVVDTRTQEGNNLIRSCAIASNQVPTSASGDLLAFVYNLQNHVKNHYGDVNQFLVDHSITVSTYFAYLSNWVGFTINAGNIS